MGILDDDLPMAGGSGYTIGQDLSTISIEELTEQIEALRTEIARIEQEISAKKSSLADADTFFKS